MFEVAVNVKPVPAAVIERTAILKKIINKINIILEI